MAARDVGEHIRRERTRRRQTRREFALETGMSVRTLASIETGEHGRREADTRVKIETALGWEPGSFTLVANENRPPVIREDPDLARIRSAWPRLSPRMREAFAEFVAHVIHNP